MNQPGSYLLTAAAVAGLTSAAASAPAQAKHRRQTVIDGRRLLLPGADGIPVPGAGCSVPAAHKVPGPPSTL